MLLESRDNIQKKLRSLFQTPVGRAFFLVALIAIAIGGLAWFCWQHPKINFLTSDRRAQWINFPNAIGLSTHRARSVDAVFQREFRFERQPHFALLHVRAGKRLELKINGVPVNISPPKNWKTVSTVNVLSILHAGTNTIDARVFNNDAPPALWLALVSDELTLRSDPTWQASFTGSAWRNAAFAEEPHYPRPGNPLAGGGRIVGALARVWPAWLIFTILAIVALVVARRWTGKKLTQRHVHIVLIVIVATWLALFWNNARLLPSHRGFDAKAHLDYVNYLQERKALPLPHEGFEMFQPPLYYALSAAVLSSCGLSIDDPGAPLVLRTLNMVFGIAHFIFIFLALRLLFPDQPGRQMVGLVLAAFVGVQLYLSHYITNEVLASALAAASVYLALRLLIKERSPTSEYIWLGVCLGAGLLAKVTLGLLVPIVVAALAIKLAVGRVSIATWLRTLGVTVLFLFTVCGWHYLRIWRHVGTPFATNLMANTTWPWWQDPGYRTVNDYLRFGQSLVAPLFSGFHGFWDSLYSTMWGDALCAGATSLDYRTPWNYDLMVAGYLLAILPSALILIGAVVAISRFMRKPSTELFLLLAFGATIMLAIIGLTLAVSHTQVKAFYGLSALVVICYFAALGWGVIERSGKTLQFAFTIVFALWALNSFASVWIRPTADQHIYAGTFLREQHQPASAAAEAIKAVEIDPASARARRFHALVLDDAGDYGKALEEARQSTRLAPTDSNAYLQVGHALVNQGRTQQALDEARRAIELGPENSIAYDLLLICLVQLGRNAEAIDAARDALAVSPFSADLHQTLAIAATRQNDFVTAAQQGGYALLFRPKWRAAHTKLQKTFVSLGNRAGGAKALREIAASAPDSPMMLNELAWLFATHPEAAWRDGVEALRLAERACALTDRSDQALLATLAAAQAETGNFEQAKSTAESALLQATSSRDERASSLLNNLLISFRANLPYRASYP